jgi:hypothetical protein
MVRMFVFPFGNGYYEKQSAVVLAETIEEAHAKLLADIARQVSNQPPLPRWIGDNGFVPGHFSPERLNEATKAAAKEGDERKYMLPWEATGDVAYVVGWDG